MHTPAHRSCSFFSRGRWLPVAMAIFSPLVTMAAEAQGRPPRAERVADRIAERRYARMSIAEARVARAEARVAEIAPVVPVPPPPRPATVRRMARAGVPLSGPPVVVVPPRLAEPPAIVGPVVTATPIAPPPLAATRRPAPSAQVNGPATRSAAPEPGAWTLAPDDTVAPAAAEVSPDGTRSVLSAGGGPATPAKPEASAPAAARPGPAVTQPPVELLPTPEAK